MLGLCRTSLLVYWGRVFRCNRLCKLAFSLLAIGRLLWLLGISPSGFLMARALQPTDTSADSTFFSYMASISTSSVSTPIKSRHYTLFSGVILLISALTLDIGSHLAFPKYNTLGVAQWDSFVPPSLALRVLSNNLCFTSSDLVRMFSGRSAMVGISALKMSAHEPWGCHMGSVLIFCGALVCFRGCAGWFSIWANLLFSGLGDFQGPVLLPILTDITSTNFLRRLTSALFIISSKCFQTHLCTFILYFSYLYFDALVTCQLFFIISKFGVVGR